VGKKTGLLHLKRGQQRYGVLFRRGDAVSARTDVKQHRLGETLVRLGLLSDTDLGRADWLMTSQGGRLGHALKELGILTEEGLREALSLHVREVLQAVFGWNDGDYLFEELDPESLLAEETTLGLPLEALILEAVRRIEDPDVVRYVLGNLDRLLKRTTDAELRLRNISLTPVDGYLLSRVDGTLRAREVLQLAPMEPAEAQKSLYGLLCAGVLEYFKETPRKEARAAAAPPPPPAPAAAERPPQAPSERRVASASAPEPGPRAAPARGEPGTAPPISDNAQGTRREVLEAHEGLKKRNHFEVLGVPRDASLAQIKEAYFALAKRFHPDVLHESGLADLQGKIEAVFIRVGEAYEVLKNPKTRAQYESRLPRLPPPAAPPPPPPPSTPPAPDPAYLTRMAVESLRKAERQIAEGAYWDAIKLLETAIPHLTGKQKQRARVANARALAKNPHWIKDAEQLLETVLEEDPKYATAHFELALLYRDCGLKGRAVNHLRKVLELRPEHEEAPTLLASLTPEPTEATPEGGGLLRKLFGRR
jgi:tetratricopeptide (TPR) repeat protein